ncbi:MAG: hypothetical protein AAGF75_02505 [Cyanobacteria bacterium P01_H01_bin.130]
MERRRRQRLTRLKRRSRRSPMVLVGLTLGLMAIAGLLGSGLARALNPPEMARDRLSAEILAPETIGDGFTGRSYPDQSLNQSLNRSLDGRSHPSPNPNIAQSTPFAPELPPPDPNGTVDPVTSSYWLGRDLYREACGTCHVAVPPAVLPIQTWKELLTSEQHYGKTIEPPPRGTVSVIWKYIRDYSRTLRENDPIPYRLDKSRFFRSLHPGVDFPEPVRVNQCATCHVRAEFYNFRLFNDAKQPRTPGTNIFPIPES